MGGITIGGLATGLDTNSIIDQLTNLERRRRVDLLQIDRLEAEAKKSALQTFNTKLATLLTAVDALRNADTAIARQASSSDEGTIEITAGSGATPGSTEITVNTLARGAIAVSGSGVTSSSSTIASGAGTFEFSVGGGATQSVAVDATTTLDDLAAAINDLGAGVSASTVNLGNESSPDYRLRLASLSTGSSSSITVSNDDTDIAIAVSQQAEDASFTVSGFATPVTRESNTFSDVIPGTTLSLQSTGGPVTLTVSTDESGVASKLEAVAAAYNDLVAFVDENSDVVQDTTSEDGDVISGPLAFDSTVRNILAGLRGAFSNGVEGLSGQYTLLAEVGLTTNQDGTVSFDSTKLSEALSADENAVRELFAGSSSVDGAFDRVHGYIESATGSGGFLEIRTNGLTDEIEAIGDRIEAGERAVAAFEADLIAQFASLEVLVSGLQSQGAFLSSVLTQPTT